MPMRSIGILTLTLLLVAGRHPSAGAEREEGVHAPPTRHPAVVMVLTHNAETGFHHQATGFFINQAGDVATTYHVIAGAHTIAIRVAAMSEYPVTRIIRADIPADLAILAVAVPSQSVRPAPIADSLPEAGEAIEVIGHPSGGQQTSSKGVIASHFPAPLIGTLLGFTAPITPGGSGSPLFNEAGAVVGIASFILFLGPGKTPHYFAIPATRLLRLQNATPRLVAPP